MKRYIHSSSDDSKSIRHITTMDELIDILESGEYNYYGLRGASKHDLNDAQTKGYLEKSHDWIDGTRTDDVLDGTCAVSVGDFISESEIRNRFNRVKRLYSYSTTTVLLIAGDDEDYGEDEDEVIISDNGSGADVVAIVDSLD